MKKIVIINGVNLNLIGIRQPELYGNINFEKFLSNLKMKNIFSNIEIKYYQSNYEGGIIDLLHNSGFSTNGIILNAGAYSHTSIAILDAIKSIKTPVIEVHITNIYSREKFRNHSYISSACKGIICGFGLKSYELALISFIDL